MGPKSVKRVQVPDIFTVLERVVQETLKNLGFNQEAQNFFTVRIIQTTSDHFTRSVKSMKLVKIKTIEERTRSATGKNSRISTKRFVQTELPARVQPPKPLRPRETHTVESADQ